MTDTTIIWPDGVMGPVAIPIYGEPTEIDGGEVRPVIGTEPGYHLVTTAEAIEGRVDLGAHLAETDGRWPSWSGVESVGLTFADQAEALALMGGEIVVPELEPEEAEVTPEQLAAMKADLLARLATRRWERTLVMDFDGETDVPAEPARSVVTSLVVAAQVAPYAEPRAFKLKPGVWRQWLPADLVGYGMAIGAHVQGCFEREAALAAEAVAAEDYDAYSAIDIEAGWP